MQMRARRAASASAQPDLLAALHRVSFLDLDFRQVQVKSQKTLTVVDDDAVSFEVEEAGEKHCAVVHGLNRRASRHTVIEPKVRALRNAVENALRAKDIRV